MRVSLAVVAGVSMLALLGIAPASAAEIKAMV